MKKLRNALRWYLSKDKILKMEVAGMQTFLG